jgi:hypothetical protein
MYGTVRYSFVQSISSLKRCSSSWFGLQEAGGMMTLTDAFVRVNRARGLELVSPGTANRVAEFRKLR